MTRLLTVLLFIVALAATLEAHTATLVGQATLSNAPSHKGIKVEISPDPLWGHRDEASFEQTVATRGEYPTVKATGNSTTDENGAFNVEIEFSFEGEAAPPTRNIWRESQQVKVAYACVLVKLSKPGFATQQRSTVIHVDGQDRFGSVLLQESVTLKGTMVMLNDRSPVGGLTVSVNQLDGWGRAVIPDTALEFTTGEDGTFEFSDDSMAPVRAMLMPLGNKLAFSRTSKANSGVYLRSGENDLGTLTLVPGGGLTFRVLDENGEPLAGVPYSVSSQDNGRDGRVSRGGLSDEGGNCRTDALPVGDYYYSARTSDYFDSSGNVSVSEGEVAEGADAMLMRKLSIKVIALSDSDAGVERYHVNATHLSGDLPGTYRNANRGPVQVMDQLYAERNVLQNLFKGTWTLTVTAEGHAPKDIEIELPVDEPITVTLEQGGELKVAVEVENGQRLTSLQFFAISHTSPKHEWFSEQTHKQLAEFRVESRMPGVFFPAYGWGEDRSIQNLPAGRYFVFVQAGRYGVLIDEDVEIRKGETTQLELAPEPPRLDVTVTKNGQPAVGETVWAFTLERYGNNQIQSTDEYVVDADGKVTGALNGTQSVFILGQREKDYALSAEQSWMHVRRIREYALLQGQADWGGTLTGEIELVDPERVWLTLKLDAPPEALQHPPALRSKQQDPRRPMNEWRGEPSDSAWLFPRVLVGDYEVVIYVQQGPNSYNEIKRDVTVDTPPEQLIEVEFDVRVLNLKLIYPEDMQVNQVSVTLIPEDRVGDPFDRSGHLTSTAAADGTVAFIGVEEGRYLAAATAQAMQAGQQVHYRIGASVWIDTSSEGEQVIQLDRPTGQLGLQVFANPAVGRARIGEALWRVQFFDPIGEEVFAGNYFTSFGSFNELRTIENIPTGTYRIRVTGYGIQPIEQEGVVISTAKGEPVKLTPSAAGLLNLTLKGLSDQDVVRARATSTYLDAAGNEVMVEAPGNRIFTLGSQDRWGRNPQGAGDCEAWLLNLNPAVRTVLISMEGYEDIRIEVEVEPGRTIVKEVKPVPKAD